MLVSAPKRVSSPPLELKKMSSDDSARKKVVLFLVLTFAFSTPFYFQIISAGTVNVAGGLYVAGIMWCPGLAALLTRLVFQRNLHGMGWRWGKTGYQGASYIIPVVACLAVYGLVWLMGIGALSTERLSKGTDIFGLIQSPAPLGTAALTATVVFLELAIFVTGEELGWRGLLVPELYRLTGYTRAAVITGLAWALFHYPLLFLADYNSSAPFWYVSLFFTLGITAGSFVAAWLRLRSGSVWTAVILHTSHNTFTGMFNQLTISREWTEYVTTEFGIGLAIAYSIIAYGCWRHRGKLPVIASGT